MKLKDCLAENWTYFLGKKSMCRLRGKILLFPVLMFCWLIVSGLEYAFMVPMDGDDR